MTRYDTIRQIVLDQWGRGKGGSDDHQKVVEHVLVSAHECSLLAPHQLNKLAREIGLNMSWEESAETR